MIAFYNSEIHDNAKLDNVPHYQFCCSMCIFRVCWSPGVRTTESVGNGSAGELYGRRLKFEPHDIHVCTWMFDHGCPDEPEQDNELAVHRFESGWLSSPI